MTQFDLTRLVLALRLARDYVAEVADSVSLDVRAEAVLAEIDAVLATVTV